LNTRRILEGFTKNHIQNKWSQFQKIEVEKQGRGYKNSCGLGRVSGLFQRKWIAGNFKSTYRKRFYDGAQLLILNHV
jgi:hypothetical protein